ncbi:MAG: YkgJ family cysteine cluster protein [Candidatus Thorarchaeota archaeon]|nr:MAG: YkgJ family cysteine cluster protein [Candidatus Thorarchaeota archaeon]
METEMTLTKSDIERLETVDHPKERFLIRTTDGFYQLRNVDGHCYFYDPEKRICIVYTSRPDGCRFYPIIYDARRHRCIVDKDCPSRATVSQQEIRKACRDIRVLVERLIEEAHER